MNLLKIPKDSFKPLKNPNKLLIISLATIIISNCITIFGINSLELKDKIILCLVVVALILIIDIVVLYTRYYKYFYQSEYLNKVYNLIDINVETINETFEKLTLETSDIKKNVYETNKDIEQLKSKIL